jgi:hypothetical protein
MNRVTAILAALFLDVSCGRAEQGYWTKHDLSQALTNEQFPTDSQYCERVAVQNGGRDSEKARAQSYTKCMYARGYQWMVEEARSFTAKSGNQATGDYSCPTGRGMVDAFGYIKCVPIGTKSGRPNPEVRQSVTSEESFGAKKVMVPSDAPRESDERWRGEERDAVIGQMSRSRARTVCMQTVCRRKGCPQRIHETPFCF